jgi:predicted Zn-dependent peptidase
LTIRIDTLANGLTVVTENMPGLASTALGVFVQAGARHERVQENGIAHFLEHMAFKGTKTRSALQIAERIEDVGGYLNAYTSREMTAYYARVLAEDSGLALELIADILLNPVFSDEEIAVERGVILQEIGQTLDTPDDVIFDWLQEVSYPDQPMGRSILGPAEKVRSFDRKNLTAFVDAHYAPERMIVSAAGAVDHDKILKQAEALFGAKPRGRVHVAEPARFIGGEHRVIKPLEQAHIALSWETDGWHSDELFAMQAFSSAFGGGMSSRLFQEAREKRGLCYTIFAQAGVHEDTGSFTVYSGTGADEIAGLSELIADELKRAVGDISESEIARARAQLKAGMLMGLESPFSRCERLARALTVWGRIPTLEETVAKIDAVDAKAARQVAERLASSNRMALALYGPVASAPGAEALNARLAA